MDSGANLCLFNNKFLLEQVTTSPFYKKKICSVNRSSKYYQKGSISSKLGTLLFPKDNYYYSPDSMVNILSSALISQTNYVCMDIAIYNVFYVFDKEGKYLHFHLCQATNLYRLDIEETTEGGSIFTTVAGCETIEQKKQALVEAGMSQFDYN